jgi:hypothetical protein
MDLVGIEDLMANVVALRARQCARVTTTKHLRQWQTVLTAIPMFLITHLTSLLLSTRTPALHLPRAQHIVIRTMCSPLVAVAAEVIGMATRAVGVGTTMLGIGRDPISRIIITTITTTSRSKRRKIRLLLPRRRSAR